MQMEWCSDRYEDFPDYVAIASVGSSEFFLRALRGESWISVSVPTLI